jgi:Peptidase MA superfamily
VTRRVRAFRIPIGSAGRAGRRVAVLAVAIFAAAAILPAGSPAVAAAPITFGTPTFQSTYDQAIDFSVDITTTGTVARTELWLRFPDTIGPYIVTVPAPGGPGTRTLHYQLDLTGSGHLVPNTTFQATWAAYQTAEADPVTSRVLKVDYQDTTHDWRTVKGNIVTVHWYEGTQDFARKALSIGEQAIADTSALLGVTETEPVDFFIYADDASFRDALGPGTRENVGGQAHSEIRTLFALITPDAINDPWVGVVVPHELVHLVFDTAVRNPYRFPPRWLNEGLAVYLSEGYSASDRSLVTGAVRSGDLMPLVALGGQFPTEADLTYLAYAESVSAIDYLVRSHDQNALVELVTAYKDGLTDDEAFTRALGEDLAAFQAGWLAELGAATPEQYGPQPAPAGPLPSGWSGPAPTAGNGGPVGTGSPGASGGGDVAVSVAPSPAGPTAAPQAPTTPSASSSDDASLAAVAILVLALAGVAAVGLVVARRRRTGP